MESSNKNQVLCRNCNKPLEDGTIKDSCQDCYDELAPNWSLRETVDKSLAGLKTAINEAEMNLTQKLLNELEQNLQSVLAGMPVTLKELGIKSNKMLGYYEDITVALEYVRKLKQSV